MGLTMPSAPVSKSVGLEGISVTHHPDRSWLNDDAYMMNNCLRDFKLYCKKAGIRTSLKLNIHGLRKSYATNLANSGQVPPHTLQKLLGHSDVKTSMDYYVGSSDANTERAVEALDRLMGEVG